MSVEVHGCFLAKSCTSLYGERCFIIWIITLKTALHQEEKGEKPIYTGIKEDFRWHFDRNMYFFATFYPLPFSLNG